MSTQHRIRSIIGGIVVIMVTMACALSGSPQARKPTATVKSQSLAAQLSPTDTVTPTPGVSVGGGNGDTGGSNSGTGGTGGSNGGTGGSNGGSGDTGGSDNSTPAPTQLADIFAGPYVVKQIETLGGESISGIVCSLTQPFSVLSNTPHVAFTFVFIPQNAQKGTVTYSYSIPSAGESHDAAGTYTLIQVDKDGTQQLSLSVSDHVVFKGFDGNIPNKYMFDLVPSGDATCPPTP